MIGLESVNLSSFIRESCSRLSRHLNDTHVNASTHLSRSTMRSSFPILSRFTGLSYAFSSVQSLPPISWATIHAANVPPIGPAFLPATVNNSL